MMEQDQLTRIVEALLLASDQPIAFKRIQEIVDQDGAAVGRDRIRAALEQLSEEYAGRCFELSEVASGFRLQVRAEYEPWVARLWDERPPRYSRALLETLAIIAYRQPITRADIEDIRGVSVSTQIVRTLQEREWIQVVGHRDLPGKPAMFGTTRRFLDYFNLKSLEQMPTLAELRDLDRIDPELGLEADDLESGQPGESGSADLDPGNAAPQSAVPERPGDDRSDDSTTGSLH